MANNAANPNHARSLTLLAYLGLVVGIYALICTVCSDTIVQDRNQLLRLPCRSLFSKHPRTTFAELTDSTSIAPAPGSNEQEPRGNTYIFALDISGSVVVVRDRINFDAGV